jgi:phosphoribosylaminoimidazole-succinocarboxamide synthase
MTFQFPNQLSVYHGKVRDVYTLDKDILVMVASDRISAFDVILPRPIPNKGQVLNQIASIMLDATADICPNWKISSPDPQVTIGKKCDPFKVEMVIRGYLTGHAWRTYQSGKRVLCGIPLPEGLQENDPFPTPIITPTTKADVGHDMDISMEEIIHQGIVSSQDWQTLEQYTRALYQRGCEIAAARGLILVDTKYEFGKYHNEIVLMDEIHTPDSSRYFYADGYHERQQAREPQKQLSKEFVREWLIANDFMGKEGQSVPEMSDEWINTIRDRYIELFEKITGQKFEAAPDENSEDRIFNNVNQALNEAGLA